jgi:hypothetical protein
MTKARISKPTSNAAPKSGRALPLPHERDQQGGAVNPKPDPLIEQAKSDLDAGLVDTDMRATPGLDAERREALVPVPAAERSRARR